LLAKLHLDSIVGKRSVKAVRTVLGKLATGSEAYKSVYEDAMERIEGQVADMAELAKQTLALITCVRRPLSTSGLQQALAVEINEPDLDPDNFPDMDDVVSACAGLVTINEGNKIIGLVHYTTQEYLEQNQQRWFPDAQVMITEVCTTYLAFEPFSKSGVLRGQGAIPSGTDSMQSFKGVSLLTQYFDTGISKYTFHGYAAIEWGHHARLAPGAHSQVMNFLERPLNVMASHERSQPSYRKLISVHAMHVASEFGLEAPLAKFLEQDLNPDHLAVYYDSRQWQHSEESITPLLVAARYGHENIVKMLLEHGADANYTSEHRNNASIYAKHNKQNNVVDLLIKYGANSEQQTALHEAAERGDLARTEELIRSKIARIDALNGRRETPLIIAARSGHCEVADYLLKAGADLEIRDYHGHSALLAATRSSHPKIVELLLTTGAYPHVVGDVIPTDVRHKSNETPYEASIRGLLHEKYKSDKKYRNGATALMLAADLDDLSSAILLLKAGARVWGTDNGGRTALGYAVMSESVLVAKAILEVCTEPMRAIEFHSVLGEASARGDSDMVALLLEFGARVQQYDPHEISNEISPLTRAVQSWCRFDMSKPHNVIMARRFEVTARLLLGAGVGTEWETFIDTKSHAIELLLRAGFDINSSDEDSYTPLIWACLYGDLSLVKLYLKLGANPNITKKQGRSPLYEACHARKPGEDMIKELLNHGADVNYQDKYGRTALFAVRPAAPGSASLISLLIKAGANVHHRSHKGQTPMFLAAKKHAVEVIELYLRYGASAVARDRAGMIPLSFAVKAPAPTEPDSRGRYAATVRLLNTHVRSVSISNPRRSLALPTVLARSPSTGRPRAGDRGLPIVVD
jgi:ankyrin repeat protein